MNLEQRLDKTIKNWNLLNHPFYLAWSAGQLPQDALRTYAHEYGAFIALVPDGWQTLNELEIAQEEKQHLELWEDFAQGLGTHVGEAHLPQVKNLVGTARTLWECPVTALGALYAFEAQQPATSQSKLEGLRAFYQLPNEVEPYFEIHSHNEHESEKLLGLMQQLSPEEQTSALQACEKMCDALWSALSGIYDAECSVN